MGAGEIFSSVNSPAAAPARKPKRVRGDFAMPESDYARIGRLKTTAKRTGLKVKKNELFRLGLQQLQTLPADELHALVMALRRPDARHSK